jgi:tetratricopeptide (TPR) repeat protein
MRGGIYGEQREYSKCVADLKKAISYITDDAELFNSLGYYMVLGNDSKNSLEFLDKSIALEPNPRNYNSRAFAHYKLGMLQDAEKDALKAKSLNASYPESYYNLALIYQQMGHLQESCAAKKTAEKLGSEKAKVLEIAGCK